MNLEELRSVQRAERQKDSLQHLRDTFYEDVAAYIAQLKDERERAVAGADDPFASEDVRRLTDELESTKEVANALYERRVGKVVKHASFAAADMNTDEEGMTTEERALFEDLVDRIKRNRRSVFATLEGNADPAPADERLTEESQSETAEESHPDTAAGSPPDPSAAESTASPSADDGLLADALGGESETDEPSPSDNGSREEPGAERGDSDTTPENDDRPLEEASAVLGEKPTDEAVPSEPSPETGREADAEPSGERDREPTEADSESSDAEMERATVRITADVGTVYGVDEREYDLAREDVVMLPTTNAEPLVQKNAAERID